MPTALAPLRSTLPDGTRYASADGSFAIVPTAKPGAGPDGLDDALARLTRDAFIGSARWRPAILPLRCRTP